MRKDFEALRAPISDSKYATSRLTFAQSAPDHVLTAGRIAVGDGPGLGFGEGRHNRAGSHPAVELVSPLCTINEDHMRDDGRLDSDWDDDPFADDAMPLSESEPPGGDGPAETITQAEIEEYLALQRQHLRFRALHRQLKARLEAGAPVEVGHHRLELQVREQRTLTAAHLVAALGLTAAEVAELRATAPKKQLRYLRVLPGP
jgi:hypothetical protein